MTITVEMVKTLREKSGAGMMDCKKALHETKGDMEAAIDWLRKKGYDAAAKKASRLASEGLVGVTSSGSRGVAVEVNAETDFVAKNVHFQTYVRMVMEKAAEGFKGSFGEGSDELEAFKMERLPTARTVAEELTHLIALIGENMNLRRVAEVSVSQGVVCHYVHNQEAPQLGKIGVLVGLQSETPDKERLADFGRKLAMHVAAARPLALTVEAIPQDIIHRERAIYLEQEKSAAEGEARVEKRIRTFYEESALLEQAYVMNPKMKIKDVVARFAEELGFPVTLTGYVRMELGEGLEKKQEDFAAEVAATLGG